MIERLAETIERIRMDYERLDGLMSETHIALNNLRYKKIGIASAKIHEKVWVRNLDNVASILTNYPLLKKI